MKRKLAFPALGAMLALLVILILSGRNGGRRTGGNTQSQIVVTQNGRIVLVPEESRAKMVLVANLPATNGAAATNSTSKR